MEIRHIMTKTVISLPPDAPLSEAFQLMSDCRLRHLPIVEKEQIVGIVSLGDVLLHARSVAGRVETASVCVEQVMSANVITCAPTDDVAKVAAMMTRFKIGCLPVVENAELAGIVTTTDLLDSICLEVELSGRHVLPLDIYESGNLDGRRDN